MHEKARPAYYALGPGRWRDWWTVLHPPYTAWHLSYVVIGASLAPHVQISVLVATLVAFFCAVGVSAHMLDELNGRPLGTRIPSTLLVGFGLAGGAAAIGLGALGVTRVGWSLVPFIVVGTVLLFGYNLELWGGRLHTDLVFALGWGSFPVLTAYVAQARGVSLPAWLAAAGAFGFSAAQRHLSTTARLVRRRAVEVVGSVRMADGTTRPIDRSSLIAPAERALNALSLAMMTLAAAFATVRLTR